MYIMKCLQHKLVDIISRMEKNMISGFFSFLFLSTGIDKLLHFNKHSKIVSIVISNNIVKNILFSLLIFSELLTSFTLVVPKKHYETFGLILTIVLLITYSVFMCYIILFKKNIIGNVLCNCGGILGDFFIDKKLIIRNILFIVIAFAYLTFINSNHDVKVVSNFFYKLLGVFLSITYYLLMKIYGSFIGGEKN